MIGQPNVTAARRALLVTVWSGLALETVNQLDRWRRLGEGSYEPYGASFVRAHLVAYAGALITLVGLAVWSATAHGHIRRWARSALAGSVVHAVGLAADIPFHLSTTDSEVAHLVGYVGLAVEVAALLWLSHLELANRRSTHRAP